MVPVSVHGGVSVCVCQGVRAGERAKEVMLYSE